MPVGVRHGNTKKVVPAEFTALQNEGSKSPQLTSEKKTSGQVLFFNKYKDKFSLHFFI